MENEKRPNRPENDPPRPERASPEERRDWETLQNNSDSTGDDYTERLRIVGGWLYRTIYGQSVALVFVPASAGE